MTVYAPRFRCNILYGVSPLEALRGLLEESHPSIPTARILNLGASMDALSSSSLVPGGKREGGKKVTRGPRSSIYCTPDDVIDRASKILMPCYEIGLWIHFRTSHDPRRLFYAPHICFPLDLFRALEDLYLLSLFHADSLLFDSGNWSFIDLHTRLPGAKPLGSEALPLPSQIVSKIVACTRIFPSPPLT